jgi:FlaA1/EpsC-like NDP-sugar epimerase
VFFKNLMLFYDLLLVSLAWWLAYIMRFHTDLFTEPEPYIFSHYLIAWLVILLIWAVVFEWLDLYRPQRFSTHLREAVDLIKGSGLALLIFLGILFFVRELVLSRVVVGFFFVSSLLFLNLSHVVSRYQTPKSN